MTTSLPTSYRKEAPVAQLFPMLSPLLPTRNSKAIGLPNLHVSAPTVVTQNDPKPLCRPALASKFPNPPNPRASSGMTTAPWHCL